MAIEQQAKADALVRNNLSPGVVDPAGNAAPGGLSTSSTIAVLEDGKILSATLADVGAVIGGGGGGGAYTAGTIDFGTCGFDASVEINDGTVDVTSSIVIVPKDDDGEAQWDGIVYSAETFGGRFIVRAVAVPGPVRGTRSFLYQVVN